MPTLNQLIRHGREEKRRTDRTRASDQCPQKQGVCPRVSTRTPKKPNSALRKIAKVRLSKRHDIFADIPGLRKKRIKETLYVKITFLFLKRIPGGILSFVVRCLFIWVLLSFMGGELALTLCSSPEEGENHISSWRNFLQNSGEMNSANGQEPQIGGGAASSSESGPPPQDRENSHRFPYPPDELIGGDSVESILLRLLGDNLNPSAAEIDRTRIAAEDLFEVKVEIIHEMAPLDPEGDWLGQGARALDNPRTKSGEESLENLLKTRDELQARNPQTIKRLKDKMLGRRKHDSDTESAA